MSTQDHEVSLPDGWAWPSPEQLAFHPLLFTQAVDDFLLEQRVSRDDLRRWRERGWISFGPDLPAAFVLAQEWEIEVVAMVSRSGLPDAIVHKVLKALPRPFAVPPGKLAFSLYHGWIKADVSAVESRYEQVRCSMPDWVDTYLDELVEDGNIDELKLLLDSVQNAIDKVEGLDPDSPQV
jgi:hypothetical protein